MIWFSANYHRQCIVIKRDWGTPWGFLENPRKRDTHTADVRYLSPPNRNICADEKRSMCMERD